MCSWLSLFGLSTMPHIYEGDDLVFASLLRWLFLFTLVTFSSSLEPMKISF